MIENLSKSTLNRNKVKHTKFSFKKNYVFELFEVLFNW